MSYITIGYEREKLYEEVWAEPVSTVAKRYGVSDVALRKTCQKLAVPLPARGHWARVSLAESQGVDLILTPRSPFSGSKVAQA